MYLADVAALARKDLRLELRAKDTLPAMLLFVLATFAIFHFALPSGSSEKAADGLVITSTLSYWLAGTCWSVWPPPGPLNRLVGFPSTRMVTWGSPRRLTLPLRSTSTEGMLRSTSAIEPFAPWTSRPI